MREWRRNILAAVDAFYQQDPEVACLRRVLRCYAVLSGQATCKM